MELLPAPFGKYFLTDKIATGGMAEIYSAKLLGPGGFEKPLIIKQIHPELSGDREFVDMFVAEAKILVSLSHGNIVPVYELGVVDDIYFIAMEYIDGPTLRALEKALMAVDATMDAACAGFVISKVLEGLTYAHRKGVIHRDLSPRNVMLSREGEIKLVDFGIALREEHLESSKGNLVGSYPYMSPEQVRGQALSAHSDIFSAGILLWEMLSGRDLFRRADPEATLRAVIEAPIEAPSAHAPDVPEALETACMRALARDPAERFVSARQFLQAIQRYLYADDNAVDESELVRLVARYCPPELSRARSESVRPASAPAHADEESERADAPSEPGTVPISRTPPAEHTRPLPRAPILGEPGASAELAEPRDVHTRPIPRRARGKRAPTVRTFATRREFQDVLERATPILPIAAISDEQAQDLESSSESAAESDRAPSDKPARERESVPDFERHATASSGATAIGDSDERANSAHSGKPGSRRRWLLVGMALSVVATALAYLMVRAPTSSQTAQPTRAGQKTQPAAMPGPRLTPAVARSAGGPGAGSKGAARSVVQVDAGPVSETRDAGAGRTDEPGTNAATSAGDSAVKGEPKSAKPASRSRDKVRPPAPVRQSVRQPGRLKVGANPWGEVYVDGKLLGRAPNAWPVTPGKHRIEVVFPVTGREQRKQFSVEIRSNAETSLGIIDFSASE